MLRESEPSPVTADENLERRMHTHLPENLFIADAGFQVPFDGWTHRRLSLCTVLLIGSQELLQDCATGTGAPLVFCFPSFSLGILKTVTWTLDSTWIIKTVTCPKT